MNDRMLSIVDETLSKALTENFEKIQQGAMLPDKIVSDTEIEQAIDHYSPAVEGYRESGEPLPPNRSIYRRGRFSNEDPWGQWIFVKRQS